LHIIKIFQHLALIRLAVAQAVWTCRVLLYILPLLLHISFGVVWCGKLVLQWRAPPNSCGYQASVTLASTLIEV